MTKNVNELKQQIVEKNRMLKNAGHAGANSGDTTRQIIRELDSLVYKYYKIMTNC